MALNPLSELLKKLLGGAAPQQADERAPIEQVALGSAPVAQVSADDEKPNALFEKLFPSDPAKKSALGRSLLQGGASMMMAGGPSRTPTNFLQAMGAGLAGGGAAYDTALESGQKQQAEQVKLAQAKKLSDMQSALFDGGSSGGSADGSGRGYGIEWLKQYFQVQLASGDQEGARKTLDKIQALTDEAASKGLKYGPDGTLIGEDGYNEGLSATEQSKAAGRVQGEEAHRQTDDIREYNLYREQAKAAGSEPDDFTTWMRAGKAAGATKINVGSDTDPGKGEIFKAMNDERENATQSARGLKLVYEMKKAIPNAITGFGADYLLAGQKVITALGGDSSKVVDTESLKTQAMELAANMKGDLVGNQQISNSDMEFVQRVAAGDMNLDSGTLTRLVNIREVQLKDNVDRYNQRVEDLYPDTPDNSRIRTYLGGVKLPEDPYEGKSDKKDKPVEKDESGSIQPGYEEDGFIFQGGDPGDPNNWIPKNLL